MINQSLNDFVDNFSVVRALDTTVKETLTVRKLPSVSLLCCAFNAIVEIVDSILPLSQLICFHSWFVLIFLDLLALLIANLCVYCVFDIIRLISHVE